MSSGAVFMIIVVAMFPVLFLVAMGVKFYEVRQASRWPSASGKVVGSGIRSHKKQPGDPGYNFNDTEVTNEPLVQYEFAVGGRTYRGSRITIGEKTSEYELEQILARYPVGTEVTVYYDPANPEKAVLERDFPAWIWYVGGGCVLAMIVIPLLAVFFYYRGLEWLKPHLANPSTAPFVTALTGFSLLVTLFALAYTAMILKACRWPRVPGRIVMSGVDTYEDWRDQENYGRARTMHKASILYTYEVNGREYLGDRIRLSVVTSSNIEGVPRRLAAKYPVGKAVQVYHDPKKPTDAVLQPFTLWMFMPWMIAGGLFYLAWAIAVGRM